MSEVAPVVRPGEIWESRDIRGATYQYDLQGKRCIKRRRVRVVQVWPDRVHVINVLSGRQAHIQLKIFASQRARGGYRKVAEAPSHWEYRVVTRDGMVVFALDRAAQAQGWHLERRGPLSSSTWEDVR